MEIAQLEAFERVARESNFTRAAEALNLTQPAISTRIATLEAELGGALFERHGRQIRLTALGAHFLPHARRLLAVLADSKQAVQDYRADRLGAVKLAAPTPFLLSFMLDTLDIFRRSYPSVDMLIRERNKTVVLELLHDNMVTLGLVNAPVFDRSVTVLAHLQDPIRAVVAPAHILAGLAGTAVPLGAIYQHTIFRVSMFPEMTAFIDEVVEHGRRGSGGAVIAVPMVMALELVKRAQGVTFLPESYVREAVEAGQLVALNIAEMPALVSQPLLITQRERKLDSMHQEFVHVFRQRWQHLLLS